MFELIEKDSDNAVIKVVGVGGGGGNAVKYMIDNLGDGVDFICANTDVQALEDMDPKTVLKMGSQISKGLGAGGDSDIGRAAAMQDRERIAVALKGADMVFIAAGMGGGTGTGGAPVIAEVARELGILTIAVVTLPFPFEGRKRQEIARAGAAELHKYVDCLIEIPLEKLLAQIAKNASLVDAFAKANDVLLDCIQSITDLIVCPGMINVDFADVRTVLSEAGLAAVSVGSASGENRAHQAAEAALNSYLVDKRDLRGATRILVNITAGFDLTLGEFSEVGDTIEEFVSEEATVVVGTVIDPEMIDNLKVFIIATGLDSTAKTEARLDLDESKTEQSGNSEFLLLRTHETAQERRQFLDIISKTPNSNIKLIAPPSSSDTELAELIHHLSNVYRSVGGDELIVNDVSILPPDSNMEVKLELGRKLGGVK